MLKMANLKNATFLPVFVIKYVPMGSFTGWEMLSIAESTQKVTSKFCPVGLKLPTVQRALKGTFKTKRLGITLNCTNAWSLTTKDV